MALFRKNLPLLAALVIIAGAIWGIQRFWLDRPAAPDAPPAVVAPTPEPGDILSQEQLATLLPTATPTPPGAIPLTDAPQESEAATPEPPPAIKGISAWINSQPLALADLRGKVALVDFWTYTCVNCIRTFPYLKLWHSRYADDGLVIIGVHAPEFEFEKDLTNVTRAVERHDVAWPVALDNDYVTWQNFENRYWPAKYLYDKNGQLQYFHFGEGEYAQTEEKIRELLRDAGADLGADDLTLPEDQTLDATYLGQDNATVTPELYAGYERNLQRILFGGSSYVGQAEYFESRDGVADLQAPSELRLHRLYFQGKWHIGPERVAHAEATTDYQDYIALAYAARSVNAVLSSASGQPYKVRLTQDGEYLTESNKGDDVEIGPDGESYVIVTEPRLHRLVENKTYEQGRRLELSALSQDFTLSAFTFGVYAEGP